MPVRDCKSKQYKSKFVSWMFLNTFKGPILWMEVAKHEEKQLRWCHWQDMHEILSLPGREATQESVIVIPLFRKALALID